MAGRSKFEAKLQELLVEATVAAGKVANEVRRRAPTVAEIPGLIENLASEFSVLSRHPRAIGSRLESQSSWLNRKFLGAASNLVEPFVIGMGLRVESLGEEAIEVVLPGGWRNQSENGQIHTGAIATVGEFTSRLYWEHHLDLGRSELSVQQLSLRLLRRPRGDVKAVFRMPVSEREAVFHRLRSEGTTHVDSITSLYDTEGRLLAEVEVAWCLERQLALGPGVSGPESDRDSL